MLILLSFLDFGFDPSDLNDCIKDTDGIKFKLIKNRLNHERVEIFFEQYFVMVDLD